MGGCGQVRFPTARLEGAVSVDGEPVEQGSVTFTDPQGGKGSVVAQIGAGRYLAEAVPQGRLLVHFNATKETGRTIRHFDRPYPERVNVIPDKYRVGIEIEVGDDNPGQDFPLTSR